MGNLPRLTKETFEEKIAQGVVLIDVYANWCMPCKMMMPTVEKIDKDMYDNVKVFGVDGGQEIELLEEWSISSVPTFLIFKDGELVDKKVGVCSYDDLADALNAVIEES